jgi:hypothetical protein
MEMRWPEKEVAGELPHQALLLQPWRKPVGVAIAVVEFVVEVVEIDGVALWAGVVFLPAAAGSLFDLQSSWTARRRPEIGVELGAGEAMCEEKAVEACDFGRTALWFWRNAPRGAPEGPRAAKLG